MSEHRWLHHNSSAKYDTLAVTAQKDVQQVQSACQHCVAVFGHHQAVTTGRYAALHELSQETHWQEEIVEGYDYIYFPEDDIIQTVDSVNR